jgi:HlyD family secretion protein
MIGKNRRFSPWAIALVAAGVIGVGGITYAVIQNRASNRPDLETMTVLVESEPLQVQISASGAVQPVQTVNLSPKTSGILSELLVEQGDRVTQGQVIARMENNDVRAELARAEAQVAQAEARLERVRSGERPETIARNRAAMEQAEARLREAEARLDLAEERVQRNQYLVDEGAISRDEFDEVVQSVNVARATVEQNQASLREAQQRLQESLNGSRPEDISEAEAQLAEARAQLRQAQVRLEDTIIRAPFDGIITQKFATPGAFVTPTTSASDATSATSTAIVALASGLEILAEVPEVDIEQLSVGQPVDIVADAYPTQVFRGRVRLIAPEAVVQQNVTSFQVRIALETGEDRLLSGMNVDLVFLGEELEDALVVPTVAIVTLDGETGVLVPGRNDQPEFQSVVLGTGVGNQTQILEGLEPGDRVFTDIPENSEWNQEQLD